MNIKRAPCLARIVKKCTGDVPDYRGWIVSVLRLAPATEFVLPDGHPHDGCPGADCWVVESLMHSEFVAPTSYGRRKTRFAVAHDATLRPLPDVEEDEHVSETISNPHHLTPVDSEIQ